MQNLVSGWLFGNTARDAAHRVTRQNGNYREARITYDARGRSIQFKYNEQATNANGRLARLLTVDYGYSSDGQVVSRTGTVSKNGAVATAIGRDEIDQWLDNYEAGRDPVGPPANLLGWVKSLAAALPEPGLIPICVDCALNPALAWGWATSSDNDDPFGIVGIAGTIRGVADGIASLCKPTQLAVDQLMAEATSAQNGTGLSKLSRAWDKHSPREPGYYPPLTGNIDAKNATTEAWLRDLLQNPTTEKVPLGRGGVEYRAPDGTGARWNSDGQFSGVLNPRRN